MREQKSTLTPGTEETPDVSRAERKEKLKYVPPKTGLITVELENSIAAGSIKVKQKDNVVEESWMVEEDDVRDVDLDFFK